MKIASTLLPAQLPASAVSLLKTRFITPKTVQAIVIEMLQRGVLTLETEPVRLIPQGKTDLPWEQAVLAALDSADTHRTEPPPHAAIQQHLDQYLKITGYFSDHCTTESFLWQGLQPFLFIIRFLAAVTFLISLYLVLLAIGTGETSVPYLLAMMLLCVTSLIGRWLLDRLAKDLQLAQQRKTEAKTRIQLWHDFEKRFLQWEIAHFTELLPYAVIFGKEVEWYQKAMTNHAEIPAWLQTAVGALKPSKSALTIRAVLESLNTAVSHQLDKVKVSRQDKVSHQEKVSHQVSRSQDVPRATVRHIAPLYKVSRLQGVPDDLPAAAVSRLINGRVTAATLLALVIEMLQRGLIELAVERNRYNTDSYQYMFYLKRLVDGSQISAQPIWEQPLLKRLPMIFARLSDIGNRGIPLILGNDISKYLRQKGYNDVSTAETTHNIIAMIVIAPVLLFALLIIGTITFLLNPILFLIVAFIMISPLKPLMNHSVVVSKVTSLGQEHIQQWTAFRDNFHQWPIERFDAYLPYAAAFGKRAQWFRRAAAAGIEPPAWLAAIAKESGLPPTMETLEQLFGAFYEQWADTFNFTVHAYEPRRDRDDDDDSDEYSDNEGDVEVESSSDGGGDGGGGGD